MSKSPAMTIPAFKQIKMANAILADLHKRGELPASSQAFQNMYAGQIKLTILSSTYGDFVRNLNK